MLHTMIGGFVEKEKRGLMEMSAVGLTSLAFPNLDKQSSCKCQSHSEKSLASNQYAAKSTNLQPPLKDLVGRF